MSNNLDSLNTKTEPTNTTKIGELIRAERLKLQMDTFQFGAECEVSETEVRAIEKGKIRNPNILTLYKIAKVLNKSLIEFIDLTQNKKQTGTEFGVLIRQARLDKGLSISDLSEIARIDMNAIERIEVSADFNVNVRYIKILAVVLELDYEQLKAVKLSDDNRKKPTNKLGQILRKERIDREMGIREFANACGIPIHILYFIERGKEYNMKWLSNIAKFIDKEYICLTSRNYSSGALGRIMKNARLKKNMTKKELSNLSGVALRTIGDLEAGKYKYPKEVTVESVAQVLGLDSEYLLEEITKSKKKEQQDKKALKKKEE